MPSTNNHGPKSDAERVALYLRVSSLEQRDEGTIETQRDYLERYAAKRGLEVAGTYADDGVSGTVPFHERAEGRRLLEDAKFDMVDSVLCYKLDRIGRSLLNVVDAHDRLQALDVGLRSAKEQIETTTPAGRLQFQMLAGFAEFERATIRDRTQDGLHRALRAGKQPGRVPYGYRIGEESGNGASFDVVEDEARVLTQIFANIAEGSTIYREVKRLNDLGVPAPGYRIVGKERVPGKRWNSTTVSDMLASKTYIGRHEIKANGGEDIIVREVPAIVTTPLWQRARRTLAENRRTPVGRDGKRIGLRRYLLSGLIRCAVCGSPCTAHSVTNSGKRWQYYACSDGRNGERLRIGPEGHARFLPAHWLEGVVWTDIRGFLTNPGEVLHRVREQFRSADDTEELEVRHADLTERLAIKHKERDRYIRLCAQGYIAEAELDAYLADLRTQTDNLRLLLESVEADLSRRREETELAASTEAWLVTLRERIHEVEGDSEEAFRARRQLVRLLVDGIVIEDKRKGEGPRVRITYRFDEPDGAAREPGGELCEVSRNTQEFLAAKAEAGR
jgi:site-specific DNA recombinase